MLKLTNRKPEPIVIAEICHQANKALCETQGDYSQADWEDAPGWQRASAISGVLNILDGIVQSPEDSHVSWLKQKEAEGWVYGEYKDVERKTHPCMVPYNELPAEQQLKDRLFFAIVSALSALKEI
jgi:RyR domain